MSYTERIARIAYEAYVKAMGEPAVWDRLSIHAQAAWRHVARKLTGVADDPAPTPRDSPRVR